MENSFQNAPLAMVSPIYNVGLGVSPVLIGFAMASPRIWELFLDPMIGVASDRTRSRFGRRLPYMVFGLLGCLLLFVAMWWAPTGFSKQALGIWLAVSAFLFYTFYSFFAIPYAALTIEATQAGPDRLGVMSARTAFANLSNIAINWLYWCCQRFRSPVEGMRWVGLAFGIIITACGFAVVFGALRNKGKAIDHSNAAGIAKGGFRKLFCLKPTWSILVTLLSTMVGFTLVANLGFYLTAFYACRGDLKLAAFVTAVKASAATIAAVLSCPLVGAAAKRLGKDIVFNFMLLLGVVSSLSEWYLITPVNPYLGMIADLGINVSLVGFWLLMPAYLGDLSDHYEASTGQSCQGSLSALYGIAVKIGASGALLLTGYVLVFCRFNADMPLHAMTYPILKMRILFAIIPSIGLACSFFAMKQFRLAQVFRAESGNELPTALNPILPSEHSEFPDQSKII